MHDTHSGHAVTVLRSFRLPWIWLLLGAALVLRAALPSGWMPAANPDGLRMALCSGAAQKFAVLGADGRLHRDAPAEQAPRDPCPFGIAAAQVADLPTQIDLPQPPAPLAVMPPPALAQAAAPARRNLRPPARGPPALA